MQLGYPLPSISWAQPCQRSTKQSPSSLLLQEALVSEGSCRPHSHARRGGGDKLWHLTGVSKFERLIKVTDQPFTGCSVKKSCSIFTTPFGSVSDVLASSITSGRSCNIIFSAASSLWWSRILMIDCP